MDAERQQHNAALRDKVELGELIDEQKQIEDAYLSLRFSQKMRNIGLSCYKACGGEAAFPFRVDQFHFYTERQYTCFSNCMNVKLEQGPFLNELGPLPEDSIPKKFLWAHGMDQASFAENMTEGRN